MECYIALCSQGCRIKSDPRLIFVLECGHILCVGCLNRLKSRVFRFCGCSRAPLSNPFDDSEWKTLLTLNYPFIKESTTADDTEEDALFLKKDFLIYRVKQGDKKEVGTYFRRLFSCYRESFSNYLRGKICWQCYIPLEVPKKQHSHWLACKACQPIPKYFPCCEKKDFWETFEVLEYISKQALCAAENTMGKQAKYGWNQFIPSNIGSLDRFSFLQNYYLLTTEQMINRCQQMKRVTENKTIGGFLEIGKASDPVDLELNFTPYAPFAKSWDSENEFFLKVKQSLSSNYQYMWETRRNGLSLHCLRLSLKMKHCVYRSPDGYSFLERNENIVTLYYKGSKTTTTESATIDALWYQEAILSCGSPLLPIFYRIYEQKSPEIKVYNESLLDDLSGFSTVFDTENKRLRYLLLQFQSRKEKLCDRLQVYYQDGNRCFLIWNWEKIIDQMVLPPTLNEGMGLATFFSKKDLYIVVPNKDLGTLHLFYIDAETNNIKEVDSYLFLLEPEIIPKAIDIVVDLGNGLLFARRGYDLSLFYFN